MRIIIGGELILITFVLLAILLENGSISNQLGLISCGVFGLFAILLFSLGRNFSYVFKKNVEHAVNESRILAELAEAVKLKKIFNSINEGILTFDSKFRVDEQFSSRLPQILRVPIDSIADADVGQLLFEKARFSSCDRETYRQSLSNTFQSNSAALDSEYSSLPREFIIDLDDGEHILEVEWTPFLNPSSKNVEKMMVTIRDLTIRRRMETQLAFSSRMAAFGKMAGGMGHEINNPITVVIWRASQLQKFLHAPKLDNEKIKSFLIAIDRMVQRIQNIANGMLTFAKQTDDEPLKVGKLIDMIECALMLSQTRAKAKGIELRKPELDSSLMLLCRPTQVEQILLNLILNAIDAATASEKPWVGIRGCVENGECAVEISDNGLGVPPELRGRIFEPFFTTKDVGEGTGLGLSIAKGLAEANGGRIAIHHDRQPTTFILYLPLAESFKAQA
ncbi:MAG TPA: ATP-binding protein [Oligoflexus sp.]|nr:ATP-binding protein [Oligoflexus sp.]